MGHSLDRLDSILKCIVESYIESALPVGSKTIADIYAEKLSSASIRNAMGELEERELIRQPHTSAGRIPTDKGYRAYVDRLMEPAQEAQSQKNSWIDEIVRQSQDIEELALGISKLLSQHMNNPALFMLKNVTRRTRLLDWVEARELELLQKAYVYDQVYVDGASLILDHPEFRDIQKAKKLLSMIEAKENLIRFLQNEIEDDNTHVLIGREVTLEEMDDISVVIRKCSSKGRPIGCLAVIGPTRMNYQKAIVAVNQVADSLTDYFDHI